MFFKKIFLLASVLFISVAAAEEKTKEISFSEQIAVSNDWLINKGEKSPILKPITSLISRAVSVTLFPVCTTIDLAVLTAKQAQEMSYIVLNKDRAQHQEQLRKNGEIWKKNTLGLLATPVGLISPDLVTHHFLPKDTQAFQVSPYGKLYSTRAHVVYPASIADIQAIIKEAEKSKKSISVAGKSMSQGKQIISNNDWNVVINTAKLNHIAIDPSLKIAKVGAGTTWQELQKKANQHGLAVRVMQASNIFSIGGSISANCHGWDYKTGSIRNTILALTVVDAKGNVSEITPKDALFDYVVGGYGGFGVIVEATLSLTNNINLVEKGVEIDPRQYAAYFNRKIRDNPNVEMHLYRLSLKPRQLFKTGIAVNYLKTGQQPIVADLVDEPERGSRLDRIKLHALRRLSWIRQLAWSLEKKDALTTKVSSRNELMRPPINPVFNQSQIDTEWLQEYFVKEEDLADFLQFLGNVLQENRVAVFNASVRFVKHDPKTKLSYANAGDRFAVVLFFNQKLSTKEIQKTRAWVRQVIDYLIAHDGSFYLPYQHFATVEQFKACYPEYASVNAFKQANDPNCLFNNGLYQDYLTQKQESDALFRQVFKRVEGQRDKVRDFLNNIFMQLDEQKFFLLVDSVLENPQLNDEQIYKALYQRIGQAKPNKISGLNQAILSLNCLKKDLGNQTAFLVNPRKINGYVEIGYPGRMMRPLKERIDMTGPLYVVNEKESLSDYVEAGFPLPYDQFVALNDYEPISATIPSESVDLVCMYIGLHHIPKNKLDPFVASIQRILRPGGIFILMDHNAYNEDMQNFVNVVHSIFNVATGVLPEVNQQEVRNFQSLQYWIDYLKTQGMVFHQRAPLIRNGDSTLNCLLRFEKPSLHTFTPQLVDADTTRPLMQTYLTAPEWQNVRAAQRYAAFVEKEPAYRYPYFSEIGGFWKVYGKSWQAAQGQTSFQEVAFAEYNLMNLFVGVSMTLEYGVKGIVAAPFALADNLLISDQSKTPASPSDLERLRSLKTYGQFIENTPFYQYPYFKDIKSYWTTYFKKNRSLGSLFKGALFGSAMTLEYTLKGLVSTPLSYLYGSETFQEAKTIHLIVQDQANAIEKIDPRITVLTTEADLKHIEIPRYMHFKEIIRKMAHSSSITCLNIAGNDKIQIDIKSPKRFYPQLSGVRPIYEIPVPTDLQNAYMALEVEVSHLCEVINTLEKNGIEILFIHDY